MADWTAKQIKALYDQLWADRSNTHALWEEISRYMRPQRLGIETSYAAGSNLTQWLYASTGITSTRELADAVHFAIANPFTRWFEVEVQHADYDDMPLAVTNWAQDVTRAMHAHMHSSSFTSALNEAVLDLVMYGNCSMDADQIPGERFKLHYEAHHVRDVVPLVGSHGRVRTTFRKESFTVNEILEQFFDDEWQSGDFEAIESRAGQGFCKAAKAGQLAKKYDCLHAIYPRPARDVKLGPDGRAKPEHRPFASAWVLCDGEKAKELNTGGYYEQPRFWGRLRRRTDDPMGGGFGEEALPDVQSENHHQRLLQNAAEKEIDPPWLEEGDQFIGDMDQRARSIISVMSISRVQPVQINPTVTARSVGMDYRQRVKELLMNDQVKLPPREDVGHMTAFEVAKRIERVYQVLGPNIHRIGQELLTPALERTFSMLNRAGKLPEMPDELMELGEAGGQVQFTYTGPAARAQNAEELAALDEGMMVVMQAAEAKPEVLDVVDMDKHVRRRLRLTNYAADLIRDKDAVAEIRAERQAIQNAETDAAVGATQARAVKDLSGAGMDASTALEVVAG